MPDGPQLGAALDSAQAADAFGGLSTGDLQALAVTRFFEIQDEATTPASSPIASGVGNFPGAPWRADAELALDRELAIIEYALADPLSFDHLSRRDFDEAFAL